MISKTKRHIRLNGNSSIVPWLSVQNAKTPFPSGEWTPIPHEYFAQQVFEAIFDRNLVIPSAIHSLTRNNRHYFGLLDVRSQNYVTDHSWIVGLINSHDRKGETQIVAGVRLFASDVVAFSDEVNFTFRHERDTLSKVSILVNESIGQLHAHWSVQDKRIEDYKSESLTDERASYLLIRALDKKIIRAKDIDVILRLYRKPIHESFGSRTAWSLFNAIASSLQSLHVSELIEASVKLHRLFDSTCKFTSEGERFIQPQLV